MASISRRPALPACPSDHNEVYISRLVVVSSRRDRDDDDDDATNGENDEEE